MRLERLELIRYGAYQGRALEFGARDVRPDQPDLHLIIGPNEAGKSTLLSAIRDLLFGFSERGAQDWRFEGRDLRIAASVSGSGQTRQVVRRKGRKNTLLDPDGSALADDALDTMLGGLDRAGFDRLFGLDHARLRAGGEAILAGKDDAAQSLFEAGTGMAAAGAALKRLEAECAELFKPSASIPRINQRLRERQEAVDRLRRTTLGEAEWKQLHDSRSRAEAARARLIDEDRILSARANHIERLGRARAPLRRLADARDQIALLGPLPILPAGAEKILANARAERATVMELLAVGQEKSDRLSSEMAAINLPELILAAAEQIDALETLRPEIDRMRRDLPAKAAKLALIDTAIAEARRRCGLAASAQLPAAAWRRRVRGRLEAWRAVEARARSHAEQWGDNQREIEKSTEALRDAPEPASLGLLRDALAALAPEAIKRSEATETAARRAADRAAAALAALAWEGTVESLAAAALPSLAEAAEHDGRARQALEARNKAREVAATARAEAARHRIALDALKAGGALPTPDVVAASRDARDRILAEVQLRLVGERRPDDAEAAARLALAIGQADLLADRRDAAASRIAEHAVASTALALSTEQALAAEAAMAVAEADLAGAEAAWGRVLARGGLRETLLPSGFVAWREARDRYLQDRDDAAVAAADHQRELASLRIADESLRAILATFGPPAEGDLGQRLRAARMLAGQMEEASRARLGELARHAELRRGAEALAREADAIERQTRDLHVGVAALAREAEIVIADPDALEEILNALEEVAADIGARPGLSHDVDGMNRDIAAFDRDVSALLATLGRSADPGSAAMRILAAELAEARTLRTELARLGKAAAEEAITLDTLGGRLAFARSAIAGLLGAAGVADEADLDTILTRVAQGLAASEARAAALVELADIGEGLGVEDLAAAVAELDASTAAAEREAIDARRREIAGERETIGGDLTSAVSAIERAALTTDAADAQQAIVEARAALGAEAERYIETAAAAAMLRWLIERHRASAQAPLLARAGALFQTVTQEAFQGLALDYDDDDRARIVAVRPDGARVGVEGLSEGTRDQLFLTLRLGSLQVRAADGALPLICDDLLVTSDDDRAGAVLRVLGEAARNLQVLVFSHHDHIEAVARRALGADGFRLHRLAPA